MRDHELFLSNGERFVGSSSDLDRTVHELVRVAAQAVGSNMGALYLIDARRNVLQPAVLVNLAPEYVESCGEIPVGEQCCGRAALHKMPWYVEDIWSDPTFPLEARQAAERAGVRAAISVPVITPDGLCLGSLSAHFPQAHAPDEYEIQRHILFAQLIAVALSRATGSHRPYTRKDIAGPDRRAGDSAAD